MPKSLQRNTSLLIVSDTGIYQDGGKMFAFEPVVKEIESMLLIFSKITWIGFNRVDKRGNASYKEVVLNNITTILLDQIGGASFKNKVDIVGNYPRMYKIINSEVKKHPVIHCRAPSNPAYIAMWLTNKYPQKRFWFKYAGNWTESAPFFYNIQRKKLKKLSKNSIITVNGNWSNQPKNVLAFENPCLTKKDRKEGKHTIKTKTRTNSTEKSYCFVGGLNNNKGVKLIIDAIKGLKDNDLFKELHIVGDGELRKWVENKVNLTNKNIYIHGALSKTEVFEIYKKCHFLLLPSKSEGFPKVISEAMNFGCIPIVSDVSCIDQYIIDGKNGFLINPISTSNVIDCIRKSLVVNTREFEIMSKRNFEEAKLFTYDYYLKRIVAEILEQ